MDKNETERLTKAEQCAGLLSSDLREILTRTDNLALSPQIAGCRVHFVSNSWR